MQLGGNGALSNTGGKSVKTFPIVAWYIWLGTGAVCNLWDILWESITVAQVVTQLCTVL